MAQETVAQEVSSVIQKLAREKDDKSSTIYTEEQKAAIEEARNCIERLLVEYNQVQADRDVIQQEAFASTEFYEEELRCKKEYIKELEVKLEQKEKYIVKIQKEWQEKYKEQALTLTKDKAEVINQLHAAQDELSSVHKFRMYQLEIEGELKRAKEELIEQKVEEKTHLVELERKYIEQGNHLKRDYEKSLVDIQTQFEKEIDEHVGTKIMHILEDNERLQEELKMHVDVTNGLRKEKSALQNEAAKLSRDLDLLRQAESLHLQRSSTQARCISENSNKLQSLEKSLGQVIHQYSSERKELEEEHKKQIAALQAEKQRLKRLAQTKINELKKVRQLAQQVLKERGEVESFLIESLHHVFNQIQFTKKQSKRPPGNGHRSSGSQLQTKSTPSQSHKELMKNVDTASEKDHPILQGLQQVPVKSVPKVDISELTWEEKERVLRHLFQKIHDTHQISDATQFHPSGYDLLYGSTTEDELGVS